MVSAILYKAGEHVTIKVVFELPPKVSLNILVNYEFLYGIKSKFSVKALITLPSHNNDLFINFASSKAYPVAPVFVIFSLPARSIKYNLPLLILFSITSFYITDINVTICDLDDTSFILVRPIFLFETP